MLVLKQVKTQKHRLRFAPMFPGFCIDVYEKPHKTFYGRTILDDSNSRVSQRKQRVEKQEWTESQWCLELQVTRASEELWGGCMIWGTIGSDFHHVINKRRGNILHMRFIMSNKVRNAYM